MSNGEKPANVVTEFFDEVPIGIAHTGLTKREMFAMVAMQGFLSNATGTGVMDEEQICEMSVQFADTLLRKLQL